MKYGIFPELSRKMPGFYVKIPHYFAFNLVLFYPYGVSIYLDDWLLAIFCKFPFFKRVHISTAYKTIVATGGARHVMEEIEKKHQEIDDLLK